MKKLIALFLGLTILSCSSEDQVNQDVASSKETSASVLDGKILSFKNEESFIKEYSDLALLDSKGLQDWVASKGLNPLLKVSDESIGMEEDVVQETRIIYSDALEAILNAESKVKIGDKVLWLNERDFYLLSENEINKSPQELISIKENLEVYGRLLSVSKSTKDLASRYVIPNENRIKTFVTDEGSFNVPGMRYRHVLDLYNETVVLNNVVYSSKMFLRSLMQYRSCSTWRCTWKTESTPMQVDGSNISANSLFWSASLIMDNSVSGSKTFLLATWTPKAPYGEQAWYQNFVVSGNFKIYVVNAWHEIPLSWY